MKTPRRPCNSCGSEMAKYIEIAKDDVPELGGSLCHVCFAEALDGAAKLKVQFDALIADGVSNEEANRIMIERIASMRGGTP